MQLVNSEVFPTGVIWLTYEPTINPDVVGYGDIRGLVPETPT
jgi:hypothetical protein